MEACGLDNLIFQTYIRKERGLVNDLGASDFFDAPKLEKIVQFILENCTIRFCDYTWKMIESMRHILVHDYAHVISETLYDTAVNSIPEFRKQVEEYLAETNWEEWEKGEDLFNDAQDAVYKSIVGMAKNMRARGMSSQEIAEITGLSEMEIEEL